MMKKRLIALLLITVSLFTMLPMGAGAADTITWLGSVDQFPMLEEQLYPGGYRIVTRDGREGIIDAAGTTKISFAYTTISQAAPGVFLGKGADSEKWGAFDLTGKELIPQSYELLRYEGGCYVAKKDGKYGLISTTNQVLAPFVYDNIGLMTDEKTLIASAGAAWSILSETGTVLYTSPVALHYHGGGNYLVQKDTGETILMGTVSKTGAVIFPTSYFDIIEIKEGMCFVSKSVDKYAVANAQGKVLTGDILGPGNLFGYHSGLAFAHNSSGTSGGYYDKNGKVVISGVEVGWPFYNGIAAAQMGGKWYMLSTAGQKLSTLPGDYYGYHPYDKSYGNMYPVTADGLGFVDTTGKLVIPATHEKDAPGKFRADPATGHYIMLEKIKDTTTHSLVVYDKTGKLVIGPGQFLPAYNASGGDVPTLNNGCMVVDKFGGEAGKSGIIDLNGNVLTPFQYKYMSYLGGGLYYAGNVAGDMKIITATNQEVVPVQSRLNYNNVVLVVRNGQVGWMTATGLSEQGAQVATPNSAKVLVDGKTVAFDAYTIGSNNYFKLRDLAMVLNGTGKQFSVGWDGAKNSISLAAKQPYAPVGGELTQGNGQSKMAAPSSSQTFVDGTVAQLTAYTIGGNNYFKLRDVMAVFDVYVGWDGATSTITLDTGKAAVAEGTKEKPPSSATIQTARPTGTLTSVYDTDRKTPYYISVGEAGSSLLTMDGGSAASGTAAVMSTTQAERFYLIDDGPLNHRIQSVQTGLFLTVSTDGKSLSFAVKTTDGSQLFAISRFTERPHPNAIGLRRYVAATDSYTEVLAPANGNLTITDAENGTRDFFILTAN